MELYNHGRLDSAPLHYDNMVDITRLLDECRFMPLYQ